MRFSGQAQSEPIHHTSKKFRVRSFTIHFPSPISKSFTSHNMRIATCASGRWTISRTLSFQVVNNKNTGTAAGLGLSRGSRRPCLPLRTWVSAAGSREAASAPSFGFKTRRGSRLVSSQAAPGPNSDVTQVPNPDDITMPVSQYDLHSADCGTVGKAIEALSSDGPLHCRTDESNRALARQAQSLYG